MVSGKCRLCGKMGPLCNSHIIPEFVYGPAYDYQHKLHVLNLSSRIKQYRIQKGIKERMLCLECETFLNEMYEKSFCEFWFTKKILPNPFPKGIYWVKNINYVAFKLFHLSVLFRAHFSKEGMFKDIHLGARHVSRLRELLKSGNPGSSNEFPIIATVALDDARVPRYDLILSPGNLRSGTHRFACFIFGACCWIYRVSKHPEPRGDKYILREDGSIPLIGRHLKNTHGFKDFYREFLKY